MQMRATANMRLQWRIWSTFSTCRWRCRRFETRWKTRSRAGSCWWLISTLWIWRGPGMSCWPRCTRWTDPILIRNRWLVLSAYHLTYYCFQLLVNFFKGVDSVVAELAKNMWFILGRTLEMVKVISDCLSVLSPYYVQGNEHGGGPQEVVTCLRIVEREERWDNFRILITKVFLE